MYYVIYDLNDNIVAYIDSKIELSLFTGLRLGDINYKFKKSNNGFINCVVDHKFLKVYCFVN